MANYWFVDYVGMILNGIIEMLVNNKDMIG